jgi:hypothetical protein
MLDELDREFEAETGFGTGLRRHLRGLEEPAAAEPDAAVEVAPQPEPEQPDPREVAIEQLLLQLERRERDVVGREQSLAVREQALAKEATRIAAERAELEKHLDVRELLRERAEREAERLWRTFDEALEATGANGVPDYQTRLNAARALLAEAYASHVDPAADPAVPDQLAELRERKVSQSSSHT